MKKCLIVLLILLLIPLKVSAKSGCCSKHGGVFGCTSSGRQICNDGTLSPTCTCTPSEVSGCTDVTAKNYKSAANVEDGSCQYYIKGCMDKDSINFDPKAEKDDNNCIKKVVGCMDKNSQNYNQNANVNAEELCIIKVESTAVILDDNEAVSTPKSEEDESSLFGGVALLSAGGIAYFIHKNKKK